MHWFNQTVAECTEVLQLEPLDGRTLFRRGMAYMDLHDDANALVDIKVFILAPKASVHIFRCLISFGVVGRWVPIRLTSQAARVVLPHDKAVRAAFIELRAHAPPAPRPVETPSPTSKAWQGCRACLKTTTVTEHAPATSLTQVHTDPMDIPRRAATMTDTASVSTPSVYSTTTTSVMGGLTNGKDSALLRSPGMTTSVMGGRTGSNISPAHLASPTTTTSVVSRAHAAVLALPSVLSSLPGPSSTSTSVMGRAGGAIMGSTSVMGPRGGGGPAHPTGAGGASSPPPSSFSFFCDGKVRTVKR